VKYSNDLTIKLGDFFISLLTQFPQDIFERTLLLSLLEKALL
jgi:hypothetical protein